MNSPTSKSKKKLPQTTQLDQGVPLYSTDLLPTYINTSKNFRQMSEPVPVQTYMTDTKGSTIPTALAWTKYLKRHQTLNVGFS